MRLRFLAFLLMTMTLPASVTASQNAIVTMSFDPDHFLALLDTLVSITVTNAGTDEIRLTGQLRLHVTSPDGTKWIWQQPRGDILFPDHFDYADPKDLRLVLTPGASNTFYLRTAYQETSVLPADAGTNNATAVI